MSRIDTKLLKGFFLVTDIGMICYWTITYLKLIPAEYLFKDYMNPLVVTWNWSFLPLDLLIPFTGLTSIYFMKENKVLSERIAIVSLALTSASGLQAISFWFIQSDFDMSWWIPNLYLLLYPVYFLFKLLTSEEK